MRRNFIGCILLFSLSGCVALGVGAAKLLPPKQISAAYKGLRGHSVGVMVWVDRGLRLDYPGIQLDIASGLQHKLRLAQTKGKSKDLIDVTFPIRPESIVKYQQTYPQIEGMEMTDVAPKIGVQRLIYIEVDSFSTRPQPSIELFRGDITGTVKVFEVGPDGKAKLAFTDSDVHASFPKNAPVDGVPSVGDYPIYRGTLDAFTTELVHRFVQYEEETDD